MLAFGLTIHKSQGLTLDNVVVNCTGTFAAGQLAVAIGRSRNTAGLCVVNFQPKRHIIAINPEVAQFYGRSSADIQVDLKCCKTFQPAIVMYTSSENAQFANNESECLTSDEDTDEDTERTIDVLHDLEDNVNESFVDMLEETVPSVHVPKDEVFDSVCIDADDKLNMLHAPYIQEFINSPC
jgi:hypothetical protein